MGAVNSSPVVPRHGEITGLTSLISTGAQAGVLLYSRTIQNKSLTFAMRFGVTALAKLRQDSQLAPPATKGSFTLQFTDDYCKAGVTCYRKNPYTGPCACPS